MSLPHAPELPGVELSEVIGTGGSGVVYRGRQVAFDRPVAVKVVPAGGTDGSTRRRWEREVAAIGRLTNHPNVVPVFDAGITDDGTCYLVMPLVDGGSLGDRIRSEGRIDPEEVARIGVQLAGALVAVHAAGVHHRDVKPDNVLCSPHGEAQLTDFGIARLQDVTATMSGSLQATVSYAAPEVLAGGEATEATDVYGLGATLYACLTGQAPHPPVPGEHLAASVNRALHQDPPPLADAGVPAALASVVERALSREPSHRQADAVRLRNDLERAAEALASPADRSDPAATQVLAATSTTVPAATARVPAAAPPAPEPRPAPRPGPSPARGGRALWLGVLAVVVLALGLVVLAGMADDGDDGDTIDLADDPVPRTGDPSTTAGPSGEETAPEPTDATTTTSEPETATTAAPGDEEEDDRGDGAGSAAETALAYVRALDADRLDDAWAMTTPRFQAQQDRAQWERFWGGRDIDVVGEPRTVGDSVIVPLRYDGQQEDYRLDLVRQGGSWLIDGPVGR